jgi:hypothetical protein
MLSCLNETLLVAEPLCRVYFDSAANLYRRIAAVEPKCDRLLVPVDTQRASSARLAANCFEDLEAVWTQSQTQ